MNHGCIARGSVIRTFIVYSFHDTGARPAQFIWETKLRGGCLATAWEPNKEELRVRPETRSVLPAIQMAWVISRRALVAVSGRVRGRDRRTPFISVGLGLALVSRSQDSSRKTRNAHFRLKFNALVPASIQRLPPLL